MPIDLLNEEVLTFAEAAKALPSLSGGKPIHRSTFYRWRSRGLHGVRLEVGKLGGVTVTSLEAVQRFMDRLSDQDGSRPASPVRNRRNLERTDRELDDHGF